MVVQYSDLIGAFVDIAHRVVWCSVATTDRRGRPRSRVMHPVWERTEDGVVGWATARPTPLKIAHLKHSPYVSCSYVGPAHPAHDIAVAECEAFWVQEPEQLERAWAACRAPGPPAGFDPATIFPGGPGSPGSAMLRFEPWRLRVGRAADLAAGRPPLSAARCA
jgi:hypothetical protein